jgi:hypothetical protein
MVQLLCVLAAVSAALTRNAAVAEGLAELAQAQVAHCQRTRHTALHTILAQRRNTGSSQVSSMVTQGPSHEGTCRHKQHAGKGKGQQGQQKVTHQQCTCQLAACAAQILLNT